MRHFAASSRFTREARPRNGVDRTCCLPPRAAGRPDGHQGHGGGGRVVPGSGRPAGRVGLGRVGSGILTRTAGRVGSGPDPGGSGRVQVP